MADLKISQLTGATTPLAGTEVLPIVQSSATKKVSVADLTTGRNLSALTYIATSTDASGSVLQVDTSATAFGRIGGSNSMGYVAGVQHIFYNGGVEVGRFNSSSDLNLPVGNLSITAAGKGISLPGGITWTSGSGSPENVVTAPVGSLYSRSDGGANTTLYVKESGTGNTGWVAK